MARRNQPYLPLYVHDFLVDEKLCECSAESTGVYIRLMCLMHKSEEYGTILLKQNDKQNDKQILNFACKLARHMPYQIDVIERSLSDLLENGVIQLNGDKLMQKRMIKDNYVSSVRASAGKKGGDNTRFAKARVIAKHIANTENENENKPVIIPKKKEVTGEKETKKFIPPTVEEISAYCKFRKNSVDPQKFFDYFDTSGWIDSEGKPVRSWKQKVITWEGGRASKPGSFTSSKNENPFFAEAARLRGESQ